MRGSINAVRRIPDRFVVVPCSAALVFESKEPSTDVDFCENSENVPCSAELISVSEETVTEDVDVHEESEIVVDIPVVDSSAESVFVSEETSMDVNVCEKSKISMSFVLDPLNHTWYTVTKPGVVMRSPEVGLEDYVIQVRVGSASGANERGLEGKAHGDIEHGGVRENVLVDGANGSCAGRKVVGESTADLPAVGFALLKSECVPTSSGLPLAAPDWFL